MSDTLRIALAAAAIVLAIWLAWVVLFGPLLVTLIRHPGSQTIVLAVVLLAGLAVGIYRRFERQIER